MVKVKLQRVAGAARSEGVAAPFFLKDHMKNKIEMTIVSKLKGIWILHYANGNGISTQVFNPGFNKVLEQDFKSGMSDHPMFKSRLLSGDICLLKKNEVGPIDELLQVKSVEVKEEPQEQLQEQAPEANLVSDDLPDPKMLTLKEAKLLIENVYEVDVLKSWLEGEDRKGVINAIENQLAKLED